MGRALVVHHSAESRNLAAVDGGVKLDARLPPMDMNYIYSYGRRFFVCLGSCVHSTSKNLMLADPRRQIHDHKSDGLT